MKRKKEEGISVRYIYEFIVGRWFWFLLSIICCVGIMYLYLIQQQPIYHRTSTILMQDEQSTRADAYILTIKDESNDMHNKTKLLTSGQLIKLVVNKLNLDVHYTSNLLLREQDRYDDTPIHVNFVNEYTDYITFTVNPINNDTYSINANNKEYKINNGDTLKIGNNVFYISKTPYFSNQSFNNPINVTRNSPELVALSYKDDISTKVVNGSNIVNLTCIGTSSKRNDDILNALFNEFNYYCENDRRKIGEKTAAFLEERLIGVSDELSSLSSDLPSDLKTRVATLEVNGRSSFFTDANKGRENAFQLESSLSLAQYVRSYLLDGSNKYSTLPNLGGMDETGISNQIESYNTLAIQRERLLGNSGSGNYVVSKIEKTMETTYSAMLNSLNGYIQGLEIKLEQAKKQERTAQYSLTSDNGAYDIYRQKEIKKSLHDLILKKQEENTLSMIATDNTAKIIDEPFTSAPSTPLFIKNIIFALIVGLILPVLIWWLLVSLDTRIRTRNDIEDSTSLNIIGEIPEYKPTKKERNRLLAINHEDNNPITESFRVLCAQLKFALKDQKVIMLTSTSSGEGKSFIAMNLAASLSMLGKKTLLIDLDIRKKKKSGILKIEQDGLTDYLKGNIENFNSLIKHLPDPYTPDVLPAGKIVPDPSKLISSNLLDDMIHQLRNKYDCIIIDSVPAMGMADTLIINRLADLTIYVVRERMLDRRILPEIDRIYKEGVFKNMHIILNNCQFLKRSYYGYYNYSKYYGYNYAYADYSQSKRKKS